MIFFRFVSPKKDFKKKNKMGDLNFDEEKNSKKKISNFENKKKLIKTSLKLQDLGIYEGEISPNSKKLTGEGLLHLNNGFIYKGEFLHNKFNGTGTLEDPNGNKYTGGFKNGEKHGKGTEEIHGSSGTVATYTGSFKNGEREGYGNKNQNNTKRNIKGKKQRRV